MTLPNEAKAEIIRDEMEQIERQKYRLETRVQVRRDVGLVQGLEAVTLEIENLAMLLDGYRKRLDALGSDT
jgi:hypothetical protein